MLGPRADAGGVLAHNGVTRRWWLPGGSCEREASSVTSLIIIFVSPRSCFFAVIQPSEF